MTADGGFSVTVPAGRYEVTGTPAGNAGAIRRTEGVVVVPEAGLTGVEVNCHVR
ncbi:hypothetical protein [Actinoplanes sp. NPDC020271]|uniref:hypothetical protein n=1 Tax=Actinoplanes sp. NPDC020271 TaxID=3363896 RepID=UPI00379CC98F